MKPTRIIAEPEMAMIGSGLNMKRCLFFRCDNGETYNLKELAATIPLTAPSLGGRLQKWGWRYKHILSKELPKKEQFEFQCPYKVIIPGDLEHLSETHNRYGQRIYDDFGRFVGV